MRKQDTIDMRVGRRKGWCSGNKNNNFILTCIFVVDYVANMKITVTRNEGSTCIGFLQHLVNLFFNLFLGEFILLKSKHQSPCTDRLTAISVWMSNYTRCCTWGAITYPRLQQHSVKSPIYSINYKAHRYIFVDVITYPCPKLDADLGSFTLWGWRHKWLGNALSDPALLRGHVNCDVHGRVLWNDYLNLTLLNYLQYSIFPYLNYFPHHPSRKHVATIHLTLSSCKRHNIYLWSPVVFQTIRIFRLWKLTLILCFTFVYMHLDLTITQFWIDQYGWISHLSKLWEFNMWNNAAVISTVKPLIWRCSNDIFILDFTPGFNGLNRDNGKARRE